jgi:hypothetical protein
MRVIGHVDFCYCKAGPVTFSSLAGVAATEAPADALPCEPVTFPTVTAVDACGLPVPVSATVANADLASGAKLGCGRQTITFTAAHPHKSSLKAKADHAVHVADKIMPAAAAFGQGTALCKKTFKTACGNEIRLVPTLSLSECTITALFAPQRDACGNEHVIPDESLVLDNLCNA